ncbi:MAG: radical SAM protein [Eubacteriales bacterium]|nr:radical SAM protein [Eubacteriales bacterium]
MFFKLKPPYALRGWEKMAWVLVKRPYNRIRCLSQTEFEALVLCDGETELTADLLDEQMQEVLKDFETRGIIESSSHAQPLQDDQYYRYYPNRYVRSVFWSITGRCNYRCRHCYMDAPGAAMGELSTEAALNLIDQMADCGVLRVDLTGGEPFVRKDFWQLVDRILFHKMTIGQVYTNGWLLNDSMLDEFERRNLKPEFSISFDGVGWHDWMRRVTGAEEAALRALRLCRKRGFPANAEMCIHRGNQDSLPQTVRALFEAGITSLKTGNVSLTELWRANSEGNELTQKEYVEAMLRYIPQYFADGIPMNILLSGVIYLHPDKTYSIVAERYNETEDCLECQLCGSARWSCYITPEGRLLPCMPMTACSEQVQFPLVQEIGLKKGLSDSFYMQFVDRRVKELFNVNEECAACPYRLRCGGGCRANALLEGEHDLMGADRSMCFLWKRGYVEKIREVTDRAIAEYNGSKESL